MYLHIRKFITSHRRVYSTQNPPPRGEAAARPKRAKRGSSRKGKKKMIRNGEKREKIRMKKIIK